MKNLVVVLVGTRNPLNVGAVARAMSNFGAMELRAVRPYEKAWREARSAVGAGELLARAKEFANLGQAAAVVMYELGRRDRTNAEGAEDPQRTLRRRGKPKRAGLKANVTLKNAEIREFAEMKTVERIGEALLEALRKSGYIAARGEAKAEEKLRRMLRRFSMESADAEVFLGMV